MLNVANHSDLTMPTIPIGLFGISSGFIGNRCKYIERRRDPRIRGVVLVGKDDDSQSFPGIRKSARGVRAWIAPGPIQRPERASFVRRLPGRIS